MIPTLTPQTVAVVTATTPVLRERGVAVAEAMYARLLADPALAALFNGSNQRSGAQAYALAAALVAYAGHIADLSALGGAVERIAQRHVGFVIRAEHHPAVATALLDAVPAVLGAAATPEILAAWGKAYWALAGILQGREAAIREGIMADPGGWTGWRRFTVADRVAESETITSFRLRPEDGRAVLPHRAGQYLTLRFDPAGRPDLKRNSSISSGPDAASYRITVKREAGDGASALLHDRAAIGTTLECAPPAGDFFLIEPPPRPVVLLSGGVGLTPMVSMMERLAATGPDVPVWYVHGTTSRATHAFGAHVRTLAARHGRTTVATFLERPQAGDAVLPGFVTLDWLRENTPLTGADFYLCGPRPFLRVLVSGVVASGVPAAQLQYERFGPADEVLAA